ncbi:LOW QUALITY PROTEIN: hypothetical protein PanWU01x14_337530 [Parasponia andersonii]|uniref:Uncharacterized protein n=1 Tax=Parasponia andersonii TaxID=3476 RepID=A0A2P5AFL5_PARAD|nr:LOW QUALITY PROTEIN: hypothetical protein PanWU01x14_337530 [Parasponia andersonii]
MDTIQGPFRMVNDGIEPDIFSLNTMVKGYVLLFVSMMLGYSTRWVWSIPACRTR